MSFRDENGNFQFDPVQNPNRKKSKIVQLCCEKKKKNEKKIFLWPPG